MSGRYEGALGASGGFPAFIRQVLDLRIDVDRAHANSPVMNRVSGDLYNIVPQFWPQPPARVYEASWIIDSPTVSWRRCEVVITGTVRWWQSPARITTARITIPWSVTTMGPATVVFSEAFANSWTYVCPKRSVFFRSVTVEMDVCSSVNAAPLLPAYDTDAHATRPAGLPQRNLTVDEAYRETGVEMTVDPTHTVVDDSAAGFTSWSPAELHDAMEVNFSRFFGAWPAWRLWGLLAGMFDNPAVGGIMYDAAAQFGGAGEPPDRQGFAVFRNHTWFTDLPAGAPSDQAEAWSLRQYLYTYVHEVGHAFNLLHSWNKSRPDSLSWMNYPSSYDLRNGTDSFWSNFFLRFDDEELIHIRHGDRASVIMGGDPWSSGGHMEDTSGAMAQLEGIAPLEFVLRSRAYFEFMEPVDVELRLRNQTSVPIEIDARLNPDYGRVVVYVQRPDGAIRKFEPIFCMMGSPESHTLEPAGTETTGADRYSESVLLEYGRFGFYFDVPGKYLVRALYDGPGGIAIPSNTLEFRVGYPVDREHDVLAQDYFTPEVGLSLYLGGSQSPVLASGMAVLEDVAQRFPGSLAAAKAATVVGRSVARPFFRLHTTKAKTALRKEHDADPERALALTATARTLYRETANPTLNLGYHELTRDRAEALVATGKKPQAKREIQETRKDLEARGVNESVLQELKSFGDIL